MAGYQADGDDYLTKPFETDILLMKIKALFDRRGSNNKQEVIRELYHIGEFTFHTKDRKLIRKGKVRKLSPKETQLLELLCVYLNNVMPRGEALTNIWGEESYFTKRSMDVYITKLRKYLAEDANISIDTFHQVGVSITCQKLLA